MLKFNSFRAQRYLRSRFIEGKYLLASEASDIELEVIDVYRNMIKNTLGNIAIDTAWKCELFRIETVVTSKVGNVLGVDTSVIDLINIGDKVFKDGNLVTEVTNVNVGGGTVTVTSAAGINITDAIEILTSTSLLIKPGEAWFDGLPFDFRSGQDPLVSGSTLAAGVLSVPGGGASSITIQDNPNGRGKIITFSDGGVTPTAQYQVVISAREEVITNSDDPFIKNVNIPESTAQKLRLTYRINVVQTDEQTPTPIPYTDTTIAGNLTNYIDVIPQNGGNGSEISRTVVSGSEAIDGRNLEITIRNNAASANPSYAGSPVGNPIPTGSSQQQEYSNGMFVDSLGQTYWLNAVFNDVVANQVVLRLDKEESQPDPVIIIGKPYRLVKRDVYVTDDNAGSPLGQLFWPVANVEWNSTDGFVHESKVEDLRNVIESLQAHEEKTTVKFNIRLLGGGTVTAEPTVKATATATVIDNTFDASDALIIRGVSFVYNVDWIAGATINDTVNNIVQAINDSSDPLIANQVSALNAGGGIITLTAVVGGTAGNAYTLAETDGATDNFTLSGAFFTGGLDATPGELVWDEDFKIVNPNGLTQLILAGRAVIREGGAAAFLMDLDNGGVISLGEVAVTTTTNGTSISLSGNPDLSKVRVGNTLIVGQEVTSITNIDDINKTLTVFPSLTGTGSGFINQDSFASGTAPLDPNIFVLAVKTGTIIQVTGRGELEQGESTTSGIPIQLLQYIGSNSETDNSPSYSNTYGINQGDNLTVAIGKLDKVAEDSDAYTGKPGPNSTAPAYSNEYATTDGEDLRTAIDSVDEALEATDTYTGKPNPSADSPDYTQNYALVDGQSLRDGLDVMDLLHNTSSQYVGRATATDTAPNYSSENFITDGDDLTTAVGDLDAALGVVDTDVDAIFEQEIQDRNTKLTKGGTWNWDEVTGTLSWSANAFLQIPELADSVNQINAGSIVLSADGVVAYVEINRAGPGGALTVSAIANSSLVPTNDTFVIARRTGDDVLIGRSFLLKDGEYLELDGALAEINRKLGQLKMTEHESAADKVRISSADITQLDSSILSQELNDFLMDFSGAVINFTSGAILEEDDSTPLGLNFTPFTVPVGEYFWYGVGVIPFGVGSDNRIGAQVQVTPASSSNASQALAAFPNVLGDKKLGAIQVFNNAGSIEVVLVRRLGVGSGSGGGGAGDTTALLETLKNQFIDSPYTLLTPNVFKTDTDTLVDGSSTGAYSLVSKSFEMAIAETLVSTQMLDAAEFLALGKGLGKIDLSVFWNPDGIDDAATYEVSRNGGNEWQAITMERVGESTEVFVGTHEFEEEASNQTITDNSAAEDATVTLDASTNQRVGQSFVIAETSVLREVTFSNALNGSPVGNIYIQVVADDSGSPSTDGADVLSESPAILASSFIAGVNTKDIGEVILTPGTYHIVVISDDEYKAASGANNIVFNGNSTADGRSTFNGTVWDSTGTNSIELLTLGIELDLRVRITASQNDVALDGYGIFYDNDPVTTVDNVLQLEVRQFKAVADNFSTFTLTNFLPNADLLKVYYIQGGQVFHYGAFSLQGQDVIFPTNTFNNNGIEADITLVFDQVRGGAYDNSDTNAALLAANFLGSTDGTIDKSQAGRGIFLRRPDGTLREITIDNDDNISILSVP